MRCLAALIAFLALCGLLLSGAHAGEAYISAAGVTERGRDVDRILDMILVPPEPPPEGGRTVVFLLDPTKSLQRSNLAGELRAALARNARKLASTRIGVVRTGGDGAYVLAPTEDRAALVNAVHEVTSRPSSHFVNIYDEMRRAVRLLKRENGARELVLLTLENGDAEDDIEATVRALERADVRCSVIAREAFLADAFWALEPPVGPTDTRFTGCDNAFVDVPWGWRFQWTVPNNSVLSGFAMYGLTRLAAGTGGRVYLYYPPGRSGHACSLHSYVICPFCDDDHEPVGDGYQSQRLRALAPPAMSRKAVLGHAVGDPFYRAVHQAWNDAARERLVYSRPSIRKGAGGVRLETNSYLGWTPLGSTVAFSSEASRGKKLLRSTKQVLGRLDADIAKAKASGGLERYRAAAELTALMLRITQFNLGQFVAFCEGPGPELAARSPKSVDLPEIDPFADDGRFIAIGYSGLSLCHGVRPFRRVRLPGGERAAEGLADLEAHWKAFEERWPHTPWLRMARAMSIARFFLVYTPGYRPPGQRRVPGASGSGATATLPERPSRPSRPGAGRSSGTGPITGGD